jgi:molecular chaperone GrpE
MDEDESTWGAEQDAAFEAIQPLDPDSLDNDVEEPTSKNSSRIGPGKKYEELTAQIESLNNKYMQLMAEFENFKRRNARDNERLVEIANEHLIREIIEVQENFERAFKSHAKGEKFVEGMKLNYARLKAILQKYGLESYAERGNKFDPEFHDAVMSAPHESIPDSHISDVHERGYKLKGKIIKHAKVVVSSGKPKGK